MPGVPIDNKQPEVTRSHCSTSVLCRRNRRGGRCDLLPPDAASRSATGPVTGQCHDSSKRAAVLRAQLKGPPDGLGREASRGGTPTRPGEHRKPIRLGDLAEALRHELPEVVDLYNSLAVDLEVDRDIITEAWYVAGAFSPGTRRPGLPWATHVILRFHPARHELADRAAQEGWDQDRLGRELAAWFTARYYTRPEHSA
jgi:hypothetical protein